MSDSSGDSGCGCFSFVVLVLILFALWGIRDEMRTAHVQVPAGATTQLLDAGVRR